MPIKTSSSIFPANWKSTTDTPINSYSLWRFSLNYFEFSHFWFNEMSCDFTGTMIISQLSLAVLNLMSFHRTVIGEGKKFLRLLKFVEIPYWNWWFYSLLHYSLHRNKIFNRTVFRFIATRKLYGWWELMLNIYYWVRLTSKLHTWEVIQRWVKVWNPANITGVWELET